MYKTVIVENDVDQSRALAHALGQSSFASKLSISFFSDVEAFEQYLRSGGTCDILMMDIAFPESHDEDGIDAVERLAPFIRNAQVIYVTGFAEYCVKAYRTDHVYFLLKPVVQEDLDRALEKSINRIEECAVRPLSVKVGNAIRVVAPQRITYIESDRRKVRIHLQGEVIETYASLAELADRLPASFARCHKGFLVNMDYIEEVQSSDIRLVTGEMVPLSQRKRLEFRETFLTHLRC